MVEIEAQQGKDAMTDISQDFTPSSLIDAIEANTLESFQSWTRWDDKVELHQDADWMSIAADIPFFSST